MIRRAIESDLEAISESYTEILLHEQEHGAYTVWKLGVYPTKETAEKALVEQSLYLIEENGELCASIIANYEQPDEYANIEWKNQLPINEVITIHLLCVRPSKAGKGYGQTLVNYIISQGRQNGCKAIRLDTGAQNIPATKLYHKVGFEIVAAASMKIGGLINHEGHLFLEYSL